WTAAVHQLDDSSADVSGELCAPAFYDYLNIWFVLGSLQTSPSGGHREDSSFALTYNSLVLLNHCCVLCLQMDFSGELQRKIHKANGNLGPNTTDDS
ncbi:hypothetical protein GW17_00043184, partial [Ensete ventricosum]